MTDVVIIEAVRTPIGRRGGGLSTMHSADLLAVVQRAVLERSGLDPAEVDQVVGGCITQVGPQGFNVTRTAWLSAGLPVEAAATTIDSQCGSSQQAVSFVAGLIKGGVIDVGVACGVEDMSQVPMGSSLVKGLMKGIPKSYFAQHEYTSQFEAAERIADAWDISREELDAFGCASQARAKRARDEGRYDTQIVEVEAPNLGDDGKPDGTTRRVVRDEGVRETTMEGLAALKPVARTVEEGGKHSDAAAAVLSWERELKPELDTVNPNGGAIALGHALGSTGCVLVTKAVHEMERSDLQTGLVTMCCGGGMATGTILERV